MFETFAYAFGYVLNFIYNFFGSYGWAIIIFTILLKLIMLPLTISQQKTMKKNVKIQALTKEIQEKYSNDPVRMNQEMADLYKNEKINPFGGCLSSILQIIVILSIFFLVSKPLTFMKQIDTNIIQEYTTKLSEGENSKIRYPEIAIIKKYSSENENFKINMEFFGLDLSDIPTDNLTDLRVYIIPILYIITSFISMKLSTKTSQMKNESTDEKQKEKKDGEISQEEMMADMSKNMSYMMPFMTVSIALIAPLGLALYWFISNLLSIIERLIIDKFVKSEEE